MDLSSLSVLKNKKVIIACAAAVLAVGGGAVGIGLAKGEPSESTSSSVTEQAEVREAEVLSVENESIELEQFMTFKKAGIEEYDMDFVSLEQQLPKASAKKEEKADTAASFTVKLPEDKSVILKPDPGASSNPGTRSIAGETYTVYDEISGGNVTLDGHELICRIVNSEIGDSWGEEAIKAQAVAAYSYVRYNDEKGYIPSVGLKAGYSAKLESCINAVEGQCVYYGGAVIDAVYSASSAGASAPSEKIWGGAYPYLRAVESVYDSKDPNYGVVKTFTKEQLKSIIEKNTGLKLSDDPKNWFEIQSIFSGKYIDTMKLDGKEYISIGGSMRRVTGALMRSTILGTDNLKSTAFDISYDNGVFTFKTYGWGHGVGMSQWGACYYAQAGYTYDQILRHYYTGTSIAVSGVNAGAAQRTAMTQEELERQAEEARQKQEADEKAAQEAAEQQAQQQEVETPAQTEQTEQTAEPVSAEPEEQQPEETESAVTQPAEPEPEQPAETEAAEEEEVIPEE